MKHFILVALLVLLATPDRVRCEEKKEKETITSQEQDSGHSSTFNSGAIMQVVATKNYVEFSELDPLPTDVLSWDKNGGKFLYISKDEPPFIFLFGTILPGYEISVNNHWIPVTKGRFEIKLNLPLEPSQFTLKIFSPARKMVLYRLAYSWIKFPPALRFRVKEEEQIFEKAWGYSGRYSRSGWVQLYSGNNPVPVVDLDSLRIANLSFRVYYPPEPEDIYDGWSLIILNGKNEIVSEYKKLGAPPPFVDWREVSPPIFDTDSYTYRIDLFRGELVFQGKNNRFDTIESYSLSKHRYRRPLEIEPKEELGYYSFYQPRFGNLEGMFIAADLPASLWNQFLIRGQLLASIHNLDDNNNLTFVKLSSGIRIFGGGNSALIGKPYLFRLDLYLGYCGATVRPRPGINRYSHPYILIEPHLLLWSYHYITPWLEYGATPTRSEERLSLGVNYNFYIRPWSIKMGFGIAYDKLLTFKADPQQAWSIFRTSLALTYIL